MLHVPGSEHDGDNADGLLQNMLERISSGDAWLASMPHELRGPSHDHANPELKLHLRLLLLGVLWRVHEQATRCLGNVIMNKS